MKPTLLVMAAGMGSRYGGLKQIDPVGPSGETIMDYSIYDAIRAGFGKIVFVIRQDFQEAFQERLRGKFEDKIEVAFAFQQLDSNLGGFEVPAGRQKPWGTGHAILVAKDEVTTPFAVINADDFYGAHAFQTISQYLQSLDGQPGGQYSMVGYVLRNTLSEFGHVSRGVCEHDSQMHLKGIVERTKIEKVGQGARCFGEGAQPMDLTGDEIVSMNLWGFQPCLFDHLERQFQEFLAAHGQEEKSEFYIPSVIDRLINEGQATVRVLTTDEKWFGVTYKEDKQSAVDSVSRLIREGVYPAKLWE